MLDRLENSKRAGKFTISPGREVLGELTLSGADTVLYLHDKDEYDTLAIPNPHIKGVLHDLTKVSLMRCVPMTGLGSNQGAGEDYYFSTVFPHFVVLGRSHLAPDDKTIVEVRFVIDDASTLFYDFDAFGTVLDALPFIDQIANANENVIHRRVETGPDAQIVYFAGKREIFSVDTVLGKISASHGPSGNLGGPNGVWLKNTISLSILFADALNFEECIGRVSTILPYLSLLVGRPQNLLHLSIVTHSSPQTTDLLEVYWCMPPRRDPQQEGDKPHPAEVLLDAVRRQDEFACVLENWLARHEAWGDARSRFFTFFAKQTYYDIDRLVGAANMFDILPDSAVPPDVVLSAELQAAKDAGRKLFRSLPDSTERSSVLDALGRVGKSNLKQKIRHRVEFVVRSAPRLDEIAIVTDEAVNCRNHYVHGSEPSFDYRAATGMFEFFTDALEFVFAASDLIEGGWDINAWRSRGSSGSHPFGRFLINYSTNLQRLKALLV